MASEKILEGKKAKVAALTEMLQDSVSFVLVDYKGISVEDDTKLRKELREAGVHYVVEKNSMLRFAFKNMGIDAFDEVLHGTTAVALSKDDQTAPARVLGKFAEDHEDFFNLKAGYVEGVAYDAAGVEKLCWHSWLALCRVRSRSWQLHCRQLWTASPKILLHKYRRDFRSANHLIYC